MKVTVSKEIVPPGIYQSLRIQCGLSPKSDDAVERGLRNSICCVRLVVEDDVVGMGRLIGDGGCFCQVVDVCVLPKFQGRGLGKIIIQNLLDFVRNELPAFCYISLIADGKENIYMLSTASGTLCRNQKVCS